MNKNMQKTVVVIVVLVACKKKKEHILYKCVKLVVCIIRATEFIECAKLSKQQV